MTVGRPLCPAAGSSVLTAERAVPCHEPQLESSGLATGRRDPPHAEAGTVGERLRGLASSVLGSPAREVGAAGLRGSREHLSSPHFAGEHSGRRGGEAGVKGTDG